MLLVFFLWTFFSFFLSRISFMLFAVITVIVSYLLSSNSVFYHFFSFSKIEVAKMWTTCCCCIALVLLFFSYKRWFYMAFVAFSLFFCPILLSPFKFYWTKNSEFSFGIFHFYVLYLYTFQFLFIFHQSTAAFIFRANMRNWRICIGCNDPWCHGYVLFSFFRLVHYFIPLQWI